MKTKNFSKNQCPNFLNESLKKLLFILPTFLLLISQFNLKSQTWVSFGNSTGPKDPEITLLSSNDQQVVFTCKSFGFFQTQITDNGTTYSKISMPSVENSSQPGYPNLPIINRAIAYSGRITPTVTVSVTRELTFSNYNVCPAPRQRDTVTANNFPFVMEIFTINNGIYNQNGKFPNYISKILSAGQFRNQSFINVATNPLQWNPLTHLLTANVECTITVNLGTPTQKCISNTGMFNALASEFMINYPKSNGKEKSVKSDDPKTSYVQYYTLSQPSDADNIIADYLIITDQQFFDPNNPNSELRRIAAHRANYNGFVVAVLNAQNIMSDAVGFPYQNFPQFGDDYKYKKERRIRECIKRIYDNGLAPNTYDGHLASVLFVGDAVRDESGTIPPVGVPGSHDPYDYLDIYQVGDPIAYRDALTYPTDYYFSLLTSIPGCTIKDSYGDVFIGRFCVDNTEQLHNIIEKTIQYETAYDFTGWKNQSFFFNSDGLPDAVHNYIAGTGGFFNVFIPDRINSPYSYDNKDMYNYSMSQEIPQVMSYLNRGQAYQSYYGHSHYYDLGIGGYNGQYLTTDYLKLNMSNTGKFGFMFLHSCDAGMYDLANDVECLAEEMTRYSPDKGFIGIIAASRLALLSYPTTNPIYNSTISNLTQIQEFLVDENYLKLAHIMGEFTLISKIKRQNLYPQFTSGEILYFNLIGDPGLNLRSQGYSVSKNTTLDQNVTISDVVHVLSGITLTIPNNCDIKFSKNGKLIIDAGAIISFNENAYFHGMEMNNALEIKGSIQTKAGSLPNITFDAPVGKNCSGIVFDNSALDASFNRLLLTRAPIFVNNLNSLTLISPSANKSVFNQSPLYLNSKSLTMRYCDFTNASSLNCSRVNNDGLNCSIQNCTFTPTSTQPTNQFDMIYIGGFANFDIQNNSITFNSGDALSLYNSGFGSTKNVRTNIINYTGTTYYQNNGIKVYQSNATIQNNKISNAKYGISTFNNTGKIVDLSGNSSATNYTQTQQIYNNTENQIYSADKGSFPSTFRYNYINNTTTKALVYCSGANIPAGSLNVKCNNWGTAFIPSQDLYPYSAYTYLPIWNFTGVCSGKSLSFTDNLSPDELVNRFLNQIDIENSDNPDNLILLNHVSDQLLKNENGKIVLDRLVDKLVTEHSQDLLSEYAKLIKTQIKFSNGDLETIVRNSEEHLRRPSSLPDSVYSAIELAQVLLQSGNGNLKDNKINSIYMDYLPCNNEAFQYYKYNLVNLLYSNDENEINKNNSISNDYCFNVIPNPVSTSVVIEFNRDIKGIVNYTISDPKGLIMITGKEQNVSDKMYINTENLKEGIYFLSIQINEKKMVTKKLIVVH